MNYEKISKDQLFTTSRHINDVVFIVLFVIIMDLSILFNVPLLRPMLGFLFLMFIPGMLLMSILKLDKLSTKYKVILSIGLSIAIIMFTGCLINAVYPLFGYQSPLNAKSVLISFNIIVFLMITIAYFKKRNLLLFQLTEFRLHKEEKFHLILPVILPLLAIAGMQLLNTQNNSLIILVMFLLVPIYIIILAVKNLKITERVFSLTIFFISISFLLIFALYTNHIYGTDSHLEFYIFQQTIITGQWNPFLNNDLDSCLSISILPTVFQLFLKIDPEYLFKIIFILPLSMTPLIVFTLCRRYLANIYSFISAILFISQSAFFFQTNAYRTYVAIFFFGLTALIIFNDELDLFHRKLFFIIFSASIIISHYSTAFITLFILSSVIIGTFLLNRLDLFRKKKYSIPRDNLNSTDFSNFENIEPAGRFIIQGIMFYFAFLVFWLHYINGNAFSGGVIFVRDTILNTLNSFILGNRSPQVYEALGGTLKGSPLLNYINYFVDWINILFMCIGVIIILVKRKYFTYIKMENGLIVFSFVTLVMLSISSFLPFVLLGYSFDRLYYQCSFVLSMSFSIGGQAVNKLFHIRSNLAWIIILIIVISLLLNSTKVSPQFLSKPTSPILNAPETINDPFYMYDTEAISAKWLKQNMELEGLYIYTDFSDSYKLISCGNISPSSIDTDQIFINFETKPNGYYYFGYKNVVNNRYRGYDGNKVIYFERDINQVWSAIQDKNLIYSNSESKIFR
jgi:uncharacterized membrane protein